MLTASVSASAAGYLRILPTQPSLARFSVTLTERQSHALRQEAMRLGLSISETLRGLLGPWADKRLKEFDAPKE